VYARIDERLADPGGYEDMLADLVRSYGDQAAAADTRRELRDQVVTLFFAGFETTAVALARTWLACLHADPPGGGGRRDSGAPCRRRFRHRRDDDRAGGRRAAGAAAPRVRS